MTAIRKPSPHKGTFAVAAVAYRGKVRHTVILAWDVAEPAVATLFLGRPQDGDAPVGRWAISRQLLATGMTGVARDGGTWIWPERTHAEIDWTGIRPREGVKPFLVPTDVLGDFVARTDYWWPIGEEVPFEVAAGRLLGRAA